MRRAGHGGHRRVGLRGIGGGGPPWTPALVAAGQRGFWLYNQYTDTLSDGDADVWIDEWGSNNFTAGAGQPLIVDPDTDYEGGKSLDFNEANGDYMDAAAAAVFPIHTGGGGTFGLLYKPLDAADASETPAASMNRVLTGIGLHLFQQSTTGTLQFVVGNGSGTAYVIDYTTASSTINISAVNSVVFQFKNNAAGNDYEIYVNGTKITSGAISETPSGAAADAALRIGARSPSLSWYFEGTYGEVIYVKDEVGEQMSNYLESQRG